MSQNDFESQDAPDLVLAQYDEESGAAREQDVMDTMTEGSTGIHVAPDPGTIRGLVSEWLRNDTGFSDASVSRFVNAALRHDALTLRGELNTFQQLDQDSERAVEHFTDRDERSRAQAVQQQREESRCAVMAAYDWHRSLLAQALQEVRSSREIELEPRTCEAIVALDHDGYLSDAMGIDVPAVYGPNPAFHRPDLAAGLAARARGKVVSANDIEHDAVMAQANDPGDESFAVVGSGGSFDPVAADRVLASSAERDAESSERPGAGTPISAGRLAAMRSLARLTRAQFAHPEPGGPEF